VFSLHHHPGKGHAAFTRWSRTPSGPNTDNVVSRSRTHSLYPDLLLLESLVLIFIFSANT
jgi:hypothetical protein